MRRHAGQRIGAALIRTVNPISTSTAIRHIANHNTDVSRQNAQFQLGIFGNLLQDTLAARHITMQEAALTRVRRLLYS
jgi:hypothetical protein